jgi:hypothetical protein
MRLGAGLFGAGTVVAVAAASLAAPATPAPSGGAPPELGAIGWSRSFEEASRRAKDSGLPLLVLFDEVPGCSTVLGFGGGPLSDPLIAEAVETLFVPVAVYNNSGGADREVLQAFGEPAWNNPVVRVLDPTSGRQLGPRFSGEYTTGAFGRALVAALEAAGREVPAYLALLAAGLDPPRVERMSFAAGCFWACEARLGALDGVLSTRVGYQGGGEAVEVSYDPTALGARALVEAAAGLGCAPRVFAPNERLLAEAQGAVGNRAIRAPAPLEPSPRDALYHLARSRYAAVPMSTTQACRVNAALAAGRSPEPLLSPRQRTQLPAPSRAAAER